MNERVTEVVKQWLKEIKEEPYFYKVEPFGEYTLKEALELNKDNPKGGIVNAISGEE